MWEIKELNKWRDVPHLWTRRLNIVKLAVLPHLICRFMQSQSKSQQIVLWIATNWYESLSGERLRITNTILKEKNNVGGMTLPNFKTYYKATVIKSNANFRVIKICSHWQEDRQIDQWKRKDSPEIDSGKYNQLILKMEQRQQSKDFLTNNDATSVCRKMNLDPHPPPFIKINSKWIIDLNVKCKTIKLPEDNIGENLGGP